jgi:hypothetical protein
MKKIISILFVCLSFFSVNAQKSASTLYKGTIDEKFPITVYIKTEDHPCTADLMYTSMYRYNKSKNWIQLDVTQGKKKENEFIMVEHGFSGVLILKKTGNIFTGLWISPDTTKQLKVELKETSMTKKEIESYENTMEKVNYENNDC